MESLSKAQRNSVYAVVATTPLKASESDFFDEVGRFKIHHKPSKSDCEIYIDIDVTYRMWFCIGDEPAPGGSGEWGVGAFDNVLYSVAGWVKDVVNWVDIPDLWELNSSRSATIPGELYSGSENTLFSADEQAAISAQLKAVARAVKNNYELTAEQGKELDKKFEEAEKASRRMGRKDWGLLFDGAVFSLILADVITPGVAGHILMMIEHGIGHLFLGNPPSVRGVLSGGQE